MRNEGILNEGTKCRLLNEGVQNGCRLLNEGGYYTREDNR